MNFDFLPAESLEKQWFNVRFATTETIPYRLGWRIAIKIQIYAYYDPYEITAVNLHKTVHNSNSLALESIVMINKPYEINLQ